MINDQQKQAFSDNLKVLLTAFEADEIKIYKVAQYQKALPPTGHQFIRIKYISDNKIVYDGAYQLPTELAKKMNRSQLCRFILIQLATQF